MTPEVRSLTEEALGIGWFILATQTNGWIQKICIFNAFVSIIASFYYALI